MVKSNTKKTEKMDEKAKTGRFFAKIKENTSQKPKKKKKEKRKKILEILYIKNN